ncbi:MULTISPECIES: polyurethane esterase [Pseudomonas]|jgi:triacylglycerol lipase|uniref:polyurethane esterase n=1 Tax=Pseudomonas TaxID=286 RepID=UPI000B357CF2|nr:MULTISPECIES: polyurethanase [Pseudomonas]PMY48532.1 polyurethanase [Pseudomonas sp. FW305-53]PMY86981.1 polyurethanase [Pseudomonas sp. FW303-C2]PMY91873.1 polyurethanase [Pseudomonas sp. FW305-62]PNA45878.1 polyurethanase [Pseudomonas sp. FW306-2-2C-A10BC]PNA88699.1 polyurethanase [Pseudomonas sp. MPR-R3B]
MGLFDYKNAGSAAGKALYSDAIALTLYAYTPTGQPLPATAWAPIGAAALGYQGKVGPQGTFYGEKDGFTSAEAEILGKYDGAGQLIGLGIAFRGTGGLGYSDTFGDMKNNLLAAVGPADYASNYAKNAFDTLLKSVAAFAIAHGLSAKDVLVSGHSLGGLGVNSLAELSGNNWGGFFKDANYIAFASPTQSATGNNVLNIGYENDPVFRVLDGTTFSSGSLGKHDGHQDSATNNIVNFNDQYASTAQNLVPFSILNPLNWSAHGSLGYADGLNRVIDSRFYDLTDKDSTLIVSNLSESSRGTTWVEDLGRSGEPHTGSTFIIGTDSNDWLKGGAGNDFIEGRDGNDRFRDDGGYNLLLGGKGSNTFELQKPLQNFSFANDGDGTLYVRDAYGGISMTRDIGALVSKESGSWWGSKEVTYNVTANGLLNGTELTHYNHSLNGDAYGNTLVASVDGDWLFGNAGDDLLRSDKSHVTFVGGTGNDVMHASGGGNTFLFSGAFGFDAINGYQGSDKLVFMGVQGAGQGYDYTQHASQAGNDTVLKIGDYAVTLVGVGLDNLSASGITFA